MSDLSRPQAQALLLIAIGLALLCFRHHRMAVTACALGIAWVALCSTPGFAGLLQHGLEHAHPRIAPAGYATADAIVVLGGGDPLRLPRAADEAELDLYSTREGFGFELFRHGRAPIVVLSGGAGEANAMASGMEQLGVPAVSLRVESASTNTYENASYSAAILKREGRNRILLVTSAWCMPRAAASFRRQGLDVIAAPSFDATDIPSGAAWQPQRAALSQSGRFLREYLGLLIYKLRGRA